jgi:hypothetical protein
MLAPTVGTWADVTTPWGNFSAAESVNNVAADLHPPDSWASVTTPWHAPSSAVRGPSEVPASGGKHTGGSWAGVATPWDDPPTADKVGKNFYW